MVAVLFLTATFVSAPGAARAEQTGAPPAPDFVAANVDGARVTLVFTSSSPPPLPRTFVVEAGTGPGLADLATFESGLNLSTIVVNQVPPGTYHVRAREKNANGISPPSNERVVTVTPCPVPEPPFGFSAGVLRQSVLFSWAYDASGCAPSTYVLEAGSAPGLTNLGAIPISVAGKSPSGTQWLFPVDGVPPGVYYARLRGVNSAGVGAATSPDLEVTIGSPCLPPARAVNFQAPTLGNAVTFTWQLEPVLNPPSTSWPAKTVIEAGSAPGAANLAVLDVPSGFPGTIWGPPGTYWTRVRTFNACGASVTSDDVMVSLTTECVTPGRPKGLDIVGRPANNPSGASARWHVPATGGAVTEYVVEVGTAPGLANVRTQTFTTISGPWTGGFMENLPSGTFFGRVRAENPCGSSPVSTEARFVVGGACQLPSAPPDLRAGIEGQTAQLWWPTGFFSATHPILPAESIVEIGTSSGASDIEAGATGPLGGDLFHKTFSIQLQPGHYFARVKRSDACGLSNPSIEVEFTIVP